jgi:hypothetical protein
MSKKVAYAFLFLVFVPLTVATVRSAIRAETLQLGLSAVLLVSICIVLAYKTAKLLRRWSVSNFQTFARLAALRTHDELLLNWFLAKGEISSGAVEGLNNKIRVVTRRSYGFRDFDAMEIALYHTLGRLRSWKQPTDSAEAKIYFQCKDSSTSPAQRRVQPRAQKAISYQ